MNQYEVITEADLARIIGISYTSIKEILNDVGNEYREYHVKKKAGGYRKISVPSARLAYCQEFFAKLLAAEPVSACAMGFVHQKSIKTNVMKHIESNFMLTVDLKDFFGSITSSMVHRYFVEYGFNKVTAYKITMLLTLRGKLPQGSCASPVLSNIIFKELDTTLHERYINKGFIYTRYADDITISSINPINKDEEIISISNILNQKNFKINNLKTRMYNIENYLEVTGIKILRNESGRYITPRRSYIRGLERELYFIKKYGLTSYKRHNQIVNVYYKEEILGKIHFVNFINPEKARKLYSLYNEVL